MFVIEPNCKIDVTARIDVVSGKLGEGSVVGAGVIIEGNHVEIGRESFLDKGAYIGGGSCFEKSAFLVTKDWFHMGMNSHINTAMGVTVGEAFGFGVESKIFTHGCYLDCYHLGAPSQWGGVVVGDNVWMPNAWVNPGVSIGCDVIISARTLVNKDVPSGVLFGGIPGRVIKENYLPRKLTHSQKNEVLSRILGQFHSRHEYQKKWNVTKDSFVFVVRDSGKQSIIDVDKLTIEGDEGNVTGVLKDQLRRNGIRFKYSFDGDSWTSWTD